MGLLRLAEKKARELSLDLRENDTPSLRRRRRVIGRAGRRGARRKAASVTIYH